MCIWVYVHVHVCKYECLNTKLLLFQSMQVTGIESGQVSFESIYKKTMILCSLFRKIFPV